MIIIKIMFIAAAITSVAALLYFIYLQQPKENLKVLKKEAELATSKEEINKVHKKLEESGYLANDCCDAMVILCSLNRKSEKLNS